MHARSLPCRTLEHISQGRLDHRHPASAGRVPIRRFFRTRPNVAATAHRGNGSAIADPAGRRALRGAQLPFARQHAACTSPALDDTCRIGRITRGEHRSASRRRLAAPVRQRWAVRVLRLVPQREAGALPRLRHRLAAGRGVAHQHLHRGAVTDEPCRLRARSADVTHPGAATGETPPLTSPPSSRLATATQEPCGKPGQHQHECAKLERQPVPHGAFHRAHFLASL